MSAKEPLSDAREIVVAESRRTAYREAGEMMIGFAECLDCVKRSMYESKPAKKTVAYLDCGHFACDDHLSHQCADAP